MDLSWFAWDFVPLALKPCILGSPQCWANWAVGRVSPCQTSKLSLLFSVLLKSRGTFLPAIQLLWADPRDLSHR